MLFTRYSPRPLIATLNPAFDGVLEPLAVSAGQTEVQMGESVLALAWAEGKPAVKRLTRQNDIHPMDLRFAKSFPNLATLEDGARVDGRFVIEGHPSTGRVAGTYTVVKEGRSSTVTMAPAQGWLPRPTKASLRFLYTVAGIFRKWPATYEWTARIHEEETGTYMMHSAWRRLNH
jgi:hypothetical protein